MALDRRRARRRHRPLAGRDRRRVRRGRAVPARRRPRGRAAQPAAGGTDRRRGHGVAGVLRRPRPRVAGRPRAIGSASPRSTAARPSWSPARVPRSTSWSRQCEALEIRARRIDVDYASHSAQVEAIRDDCVAALADIEPRSSRIAFFSTVTGELVDAAALDADYWYRNIRQTVEFDAAVRTACAHGYRAFIESSPHPALIAGIEDTVADCPAPTPTRRRAVARSRRRRPRPLPDLRRAGLRFRCGVDWRRVVRRRRTGRPADVCLSAAAVLVVRGGSGARTRRASGWQAPSTRCWARSSRCPTSAGGVDGQAGAVVAGLVGRSCRRRGGAVPRRRVRGVGDPRGRRGGLPRRRRADVAGPLVRGPVRGVRSG